MEPKHAAGVRLIVSLAAGLWLCAGAVPHPPSSAPEADKPGEDAWTNASRDKLAAVFRQSSGSPAQDGPGAAAFRPDGGRHACPRPDAGAPLVKPEWPEIVDFRLGLLAPLKFATNYVDGGRMVGR